MYHQLQTQIRKLKKFNQKLRNYFEKTSNNFIGKECWKSFSLTNATSTLWRHYKAKYELKRNQLTIHKYIDKIEKFTPEIRKEQRVS